MNLHHWLFGFFTGEIGVLWRMVQWIMRPWALESHIPELMSLKGPFIYKILTNSGERF